MSQPAGGSPHQRRYLAVVLAGVAGFVDAAGFLLLDLFTAHMSGNSARLGAYAGHGFFLRAAPSGFAIGLFVMSIGLGTLAVEVGWRHRLRSPAAWVMVAETLLLATLAGAGALALRHGVIPQSPAGIYYPLAATAVVAMGLQTCALQRVSGRTVRTTYISGMLTHLAEETVGYLLGPPPGEPEKTSFLASELNVQPGRASPARIRLIAAIWCAYAAGALLGSYLEGSWHTLSLFVPVGLLIGVIATEFASPYEAHDGTQSREPLST